MSRKIIDNVSTLTTPQEMMQAIDDNFEELYLASGGTNTDAETVDGLDSLELMGRTDSTKGTGTDPDTVDAGFIISNHVNTPWEGAYWVIHTMQVHNNTTKKVQIAIRMDSTTRLFIRQHDGISWYEWARCDNDYRVTNLGSISSTGTWTITDCVVNRPLIITGLPTGGGAYARFRATSGADTAYTAATSSRFALSASTSQDNSTGCGTTMIATSDTVVIEVTGINDMTLNAYT